MAGSLIIYLDKVKKNNKGHLGCKKSTNNQLLITTAHAEIFIVSLGPSIQPVPDDWFAGRNHLLYSIDLLN